MSERRLGYFKVPRQIQNMPAFADLLAHVLFVPEHVEFLAYCEEYKMIGASPEFRLLIDGEEIPQYYLAIHVQPGQKSPEYTVKEINTGTGNNVRIHE